MGPMGLKKPLAKVGRPRKRNKLSKALQKAWARKRYLRMMSEVEPTPPEHVQLYPNTWEGCDDSIVIKIEPLDGCLTVTPDIEEQEKGSSEELTGERNVTADCSGTEDDPNRHHLNIKEEIEDDPDIPAPTFAFVDHMAEPSFVKTEWSSAPDSSEEDPLRLKHEGFEETFERCEDSYITSSPRCQPPQESPSHGYIEEDSLPLKVEIVEGTWEENKFGDSSENDGSAFSSGELNGQNISVELSDSPRTSKCTFSCLKCGVHFDSKDDLKRHSFVHARERNFCCNECDRKFTTKVNLKEHIISTYLTKKGRRRLKSCTVCTMKFRHRSQVKRHMLVHSGEKPFNCQKCERKFSLKSNLKDHIISVHTKRDSCFPCQLCSKKFNNANALKKHLAVHKGDREFTCPECEKKFKSTSNLKRHLVIHSGERRFGCPQCEKKFIYNCELKTHMVVHTGEQLFSCRECVKKFKQRGSLRKHMMFHEEERRSACLDYNFTQNNYPQNHITVESQPVVPPTIGFPILSQILSSPSTGPM